MIFRNCLIALPLDDDSQETLFGRGIAYARHGRHDPVAADVARTRHIETAVDALVAKDKIVPPAGM